MEKKSINSREKGKRGEREAVNFLTTIGWMAKRGQQYAGGAESPDVIHDIPGVHLEVKRVERLNLSTAMAQARRDAGPKLPVVMHRRNGEDWLVTVSAEAFFKLVKQTVEEL